MNFAAPVFVWAAAAAAVMTVALHLLAWRRPPETPLPTARFAPDAPVRTVSRAIRPSDLVLLVLRVALVLLVGAALGRPLLRSREPGIGRVIVVDQSRGPRIGAAVADSVRRQFRPGDVLVAFDSAARVVPFATPDSLAVANGPPTTGSLSAGLVVAIRASHELAGKRDSVEIVVVSPFDGDELDAATAAIRQRWAGPVRAVRVAAARDEATGAARVVVRGADGDPVAAAVALSAQRRAGGNVRVIRDTLTPADSAWAREGHTLVAWPSVPPRGWRARPRADTAFAVASLGSRPPGGSAVGAATVVAPLPRLTEPPPGRVVARWADGEPAATERALGAGCIRAVAVTVPSAGDLALTAAFRRLTERLTAPCGATMEPEPLPDSVLATVLRPATGRLDAGSPLGVDVAASRLTPWLLGLALAAALAELVVRRGSNATA